MSKKRRSEIKNPGLNRHYNSRIRQEYLDYDYVKELSEEDKAFLNRFTEEYYGAALDYENLDNNLHNTKDLKKNCTDRNNAQNRCVYGRAKAMNKVFDVDNGNVPYERDNILKDDENYIKEKNSTSKNIEEAFVEYLDSKKEKTSK